MRLTRRDVNLREDYAALLQMDRQSSAINFPGEAFYEASFRSSLDAGLRFHRIVLYEQEGVLAGWLWLDLNGAFRGAHIRHLQVTESLWGQGIGKEIIDDAIEICLANGRTHITLNVTKSNLRAVTLYEGMGFYVDKDNGERQHMRLDLFDADHSIDAY